MGQRNSIMSNVGNATAKELQSIAGRVSDLRPAVRLAPTVLETGDYTRKPSTWWIEWPSRQDPDARWSPASNSGR